MMSDDNDTEVELTLDKQWNIDNPGKLRHTLLVPIRDSKGVTVEHIIFNRKPRFEELIQYGSLFDDNFKLDFRVLSKYAEKLTDLEFDILKTMSIPDVNVLNNKLLVWIGEDSVKN